MKEENRHCYNCMWYRPFYIKEYCKFDKQDLGLCKRIEVKERHCVCENWTYNSEDNKRKRKEMRQSAIIESLGKTIKNLTEVGQILKDMQDKDDY